MMACCTRAPDTSIDVSLSEFIEAHRGLVVLTGAGCSLASGIPTYRDADGTWQRTEPVTHQEFVSNPARRRRYWSRSMLGWPAVAGATPNSAHLALAALESSGHVSCLITQNVDGLHQRAGQQNVIDLHGNLHGVVCLDCADHTQRRDLQHRLLSMNPRFGALTAKAAPDGDADLPESFVEAVEVPACTRCGGALKPDVVFFGGAVPRDRVDACSRALEAAPALLAVGSSLKVFSGFRFCRAAHRAGTPLAILNPGWTRADDLADSKFPVPASALAEVAEQLVARSATL